jgi:hypothetical protein
MPPMPDRRTAAHRLTALAEALRGEVATTLAGCPPESRDAVADLFALVIDTLDLSAARYALRLGRRARA